MKLSTGKVSAPGRKQVWRGLAEDGTHRDTLSLRDEPPAGDGEPLLVPVMGTGRRFDATPALAAAREWFLHDLASVPVGARRLAKPDQVVVPHSPGLRALTRRATDDALRREGATR